MEGIEEKQVNDRTIMEGTVIDRQDSSGRFRFKTVLPSGRDLASEWIQESDKSKAGILWAEAVRGQIVADSQEAAARARRELQEERRRAPPVPRLVGTNGEALSTAPTIPTMVPSAPSPALGGTTQPDPSAYVKVQYMTEKSLSTFLSGEAARINRELTAAKQREAQWLGILQAMGVNVLEQVGSCGSDSNSAGGSVGSGSVVLAGSTADDESGDGE